MKLIPSMHLKHNDTAREIELTDYCKITSIASQCINQIQINS